jgi:LacI family transcriptional regulator
MKAPTQADIAKKLGVSQNTVSLALRRDPRLPAETCERVLAAAARLGYRPDPMVAALMSRLRRGRAPRSRGALACVLAGPSRARRAEHPSLERALAGAKARAGILGYGWSEFWLADDEMKSGRLAGVLAARGIHGIVLHPDERAGAIPALPWERYATAVLALLDRRLDRFHAASIAPFRHVEMALQQVAARGAESAGLALPARYDRLLERLYTGAMASAAAFFPQMRIVPSFMPEKWERQAFLEWWGQYRPKVVLTRAVEPVGWLRQAGMSVPEEVGCVHLGWHAKLGRAWAGVDPQAEAVGAACVDLVVEQLMANERGSPAFPKVVLTAGRWVAGGSLKQAD